MSSLDELRAFLNDLTPYFVYNLLSATLGPLLFGYHLAELNAPEKVITCANHHVVAQDLPQCITMDKAQFGLVSSIFTLGGLIGALVAGPFSAKYGRLPTMRSNTSLLALGGAFEATANSIGVLSVGRFISGLGSGAAIVVVPIYISEIAPLRGKGFFGASTQVMINVGILLTQFLGLFLSRGQLWRIVLGVGGAIGVLQFFALIFASESPRWLAVKGRTTTAKRNLKSLRPKNANIEEEVSTWDPAVHGEQIEEEQSLLHDPELTLQSTSDETRRTGSEDHTIGIVGAITHPRYYRATVAVIVVMMAQQLCGINSIVMYGVGLLADIVAASSAKINVLVSLLNVSLTFLCSPLIDKLGRKTCLLISIMGMGLSSIGLGSGIFFQIVPLSVISVFTFVASFATGLGPVPFMLASELTGAEAVGATQSWALASNWISTFVIAQFFPIVNEALGRGRVYFIFAALAAFFFAFTAWFVPESKGNRSVDELWGFKEPRRERED